MSNIYRSELLGERWGRWQDSHRVPVLPEDFDEEFSTVTFHTTGGKEYCFVYDPDSEKITWCTWEGNRWGGWQSVRTLPMPPNFVLEDDDFPSFLSLGSHNSETALFSFQPEDESVFVSFWDGRRFSSWELIGELEPPPNLSESCDIFAVGDETKEWVLSVDLDDWSVFYCEWDPETESFTDWGQAPPLHLPDDWYEMGGIDIDGVAIRGGLWLYATVHDADED